MLHLSDIAVGSYGSSQSVILYSRPVVTVMAKVTTDPENIDVRDPTYENHVMVNYDVEWSMMGNQQDNIGTDYYRHMYAMCLPCVCHV